MVALHACSTGSSPDPDEDEKPTKDASAPRGTAPEEDAAPGEEDAAPPEKDGAPPHDAAACVGPIATTPGETCIGFGAAPETCDPACGQPFGYVCFDGGPPGMEGCREQSVSGFGNTYCCPKNECVAQPDQDTECPDASKPRRFQCPPEGGGHVEPPPGCVETGSGETALEKFYCCP